MDKKLVDKLKQRLDEDSFEVVVNKGTERPFSGKFDQHFEPGIYTCVACDEELFESSAKFNAGCGWPSFDSEISKDQITETKDLSHGMVRTEITCSHCGAHLGHVFDDGPTSTGLRYCVNSVSLQFQKK